MKKKLKLLFIFVIFISCLLCPSPAQAVQTNKDFLPSSWWNAACPANAIAAQGAAIGKPAVNSIDWRNQTINAKEGDLVDLQLVILGIACSRWNATKSRPDFTWDLIQSITGNNGSSTYDFYGNNIQGNTALSNVQSHGYYYTAAQDQIDAVPVNFKLKIPFVASAGLYQYDVTGSPLKKINYIPVGQTYTSGAFLYQCVQSGGNVYGITGPPAISKFDPCATGIIDVTVVQINVAKQLGTLKIDKTENGTAPSSVDVKKANVKMKNRSTIDNGSTWSDIYADSAEWVSYTKNDVWVSNSSYDSTIAVPNNFKLGSVKKNGVAMTTTCTDNTIKTGTCDIAGVDITDGGTTSLVIDYITLAERKGSLDDICNNTFGTQTDQWFADRNTTRSINATSAWGYVYDSFLTQSVTDSTTTPSNARIVFDEGQAGQQTKVVLANKERPNLTALYQLKSPYHSFNADLPLNLFDGAQHTAQLYIEYGPGPSLAKIGASKPFTCEKWFYPWLQTSQGDVVADGKISGQLTSDGGTSFAGARLDGAASKEAEFLVISAVADGGPFCSTYKYILTNTSSQGTNCGNGAGYNFNSTGIDNDTVDRVIGGVKQAFADNGGASATTTPSTCSTNNQISVVSVTTMPASISTTCPGGIIYKMPGNSSIGLRDIGQGRVTIYVEGDLNITSFLNSTVGNQQQNPLNAANLAIVATGKINIVSTMNILNAQLYAGGKINTCTTSTGAAATPNDCSVNQLTVRGSMSAKGGFDFKRTYIYGVTTGTISTCTASPTTAPLVFPTSAVTDTCASELITLNPQSIAFPPPGLDSRYFYNNFSSYKLDTAEYNPRF
ncbi:MAG: hypothetical protein NTY56_01515 [Patescibacteria group bacterium]|nr:hypothetical protein [Patescibacteria group bacterium]